MSYIQQFFTSRDNNANAETFVGQEGRLWWDPITNQIYSSDGNTPGGIPLSGGGGGNGSPGGSNSQVQFNQAGNFGGSANLTFNSTTGALTAVSIAGNGAGLTNITGSNVVGEVAYAAVANSVAGANVSGTVANATYAVSAGSATSATTAGTVTTNAQPNITSVGTLISVSSTGNISTTGNITGNYYIGNGSLLTSLTGSNVTGTVANATYALSANSATSLVNGSSVVLLNSDGTMVFPSNAINTGANAATLWSTSSSSLLWRSPTGGGPGSNVQTIVRADNGNATISVATGTLLIQNIKSWVFDTAGNVTFPDATVQTTAYPGTATVLSLSGNITGGNINTGGSVSATANITGGNVLSNGQLSTAGNITGGNITVGGAMTAVGNIAANWVNGAYYTGTWGTDFVSTGNVSGTNITTAGLISAAGNITGGNINTAGAVRSTGSMTLARTTGQQGELTFTDGVGSGFVVGVGTGLGTWAGAGSLNLITSSSPGANIGIFVAQTERARFTTTGLAVSGVMSASGNVTGGNVIATTTVYGNAATAFVAGSAATSGVALQMPQEGALRNLNNGLTNMYFDVSTGGSTNGQFQFRSSNAFTNVLTMSPTAFNVNTEATVTARTPSLGRLAWNSAIDTELTIDNMRFRISNQGGIFPQVIGNGSSRNLAWTVVAARSGSAITQTGSTGTIVADNAWTSLYTSGGMDSSGDTYTVTLQDKAAGRIYRVTFMRSDNGATTGYNIIAERLL
jgi:filamentous hemagglutinin